MHRYTFRNFLIGLSISVTVMIIAFEWTTEKIESNTFTEDSVPFDSFVAVMSDVKEEPKPVRLLEKKIQPLLKNYDIIESKSEDEPDSDPIIDLPEKFNERNFSPFEINSPAEDTITIHVNAELQPQPVGGYGTFYLQIGNSIKYPHQALNNNIQGKVFVEFVVDRRGKVSQLKVLKGIGSGCDEEALRVIAHSNWEPGKQRGKPVSVRMVIPIIFRLK